jgi:adenine-specific DNA-methyltransferase
MPIKYVPFHPEPIEGQALLNNFTRTRRALAYRDNDKPAQRILRGMPLYEVDKVEQVGDNPNGSLVIRGECLSACAYLKDRGIQVDLVYIDPPFASGANYAKKIYLRRNPKVAQAIEQAEQELNDEELRAFEETMYGDIWTKEAYLNWMYENLVAIKSVMSPTASIYVHLDWHIAHYVKVLMDEVFGEDNFRNDIRWKRQPVRGAKATGNQYARNSDILLFYAKSEEYIWNNAYKEYAEEFVKSRFKREINGRPYRDSDLGDYSEESIKKFEKEGRIYITKSGKKRLIRFLDEERGEAVGDIWNDIPEVNSQAEERTDYATQKPEALLKRIIEASSNAGMVVADFFGGSGVTAKVAHDLGRKFIHVDVGINSIQTTRDRLKSAGASFDILEVRDGVALFRNPAQTMEKLAALIPGLGQAEGLDDFWAGAIQDGKNGMIPVYLPNLLDHRAKLLDLPQINRIVNEQIPNLPDGVKKVIVYYVDIEDEKEARAFIREYGSPLVEVELRDLKTVLHEIVLNDEVDYTLTKTAEGGWRVEITRFHSDRLAQKIEAHNQKLQLNAGNKKARQRKLEEAAQESEESLTELTPLEISENGLELIELVSLDCTADDGPWHSDAEIKIDKKGYVIRDGVRTKEYWDAAISSSRKPLLLKIRNIAGDETVVRVE